MGLYVWFRKGWVLVACTKLLQDLDEHCGRSATMRPV